MSSRSDSRRCAEHTVAEARQQGRFSQLSDATLLETYLALAESLAEKVRDRLPLIVAFSGSPGTGKSTVVEVLELYLATCFGLTTASFSLDDVYRRKAERQRLATQIHPLLATRGPPGSHDLGLAHETLDSLMQAESDAATPVPRFDKLRDDRYPISTWPIAHGRPQLILLDNWFWNLAAVPEAELLLPRSLREAREDPDAVFRRWANRAVADDYSVLFRRADFWIHLQAPSWESTVRWRVEQQRALEERSPTMTRRSEGEIRHFLQLFQPWLEHPWTQAPDVLLALNEQHEPRFRALGERRDAVEALKEQNLQLTSPADTLSAMDPSRPPDSVVAALQNANKETVVAVLEVMYFVARADGSVSADELRPFLKVAKVVAGGQVNAKELSTLVSSWAAEQNPDARTRLAELATVLGDAKTKRAAYRLASQVAAADGTVQEREMAILDLIEDVLELG